MEETRECFRNRKFIEDTLENILCMDYNKKVKCVYNLFHMEENRRQFFWYESFGNLAFISRSGEVYLLTPSVADQYGLYHVTFTNMVGYLYTSCLYPAMAGGEWYYLNGFDGIACPYIKTWALKELEEDISKFEKSVKNVDKNSSYYHHIEETIILARELAEHVWHSEVNWKSVLTEEDQYLLDAIEQSIEHY